MPAHPIPGKYRGHLRGPNISLAFTLDELISAVKGHVTGRARLDGTYEIR